MTTAPDILLILADRHRRDYTGHAGASLVQTPNIDRLARGGIWFDRAAAIFPQSGPSLASVLGGTYPQPDAVAPALGDSPLGRAMAQAGYALVEVPPGADLTATARAGAEAIRTACDGPRLLVVRLPAIDGETDDLPIEALVPYRGNGIPLAMHFAAVTALDMAVGMLLAALEGSAQADRTAVIYASVVGDQLKFRDAANRTNTCYDDCIRVPLILRLPGGPEGMRREELVGLHDLAPTICALGGTDLPAGQGASVLPLLKGGAPWRTSLYLHNRHLRHIAVSFVEGRAYYGTFPPWDQRAIWDGRHKLILSFEDGRRSLFDTGIDPEEEFDLYGAPVRRTPMDELIRFRDTGPKVVELATEMAAWADRMGDAEGRDLARQVAANPQPMHRPLGKRI
ncbi:sulfatase family protein [Halovulum sp. GXIMD14794]